MPESIIATIITGVITLVGIFVSASATLNKVTNELDKANALQSKEIDHIKEEISEMKKDIKEHNGYARMFAETMPVVQEKISIANHRIEDLERKVN